MIKKIIKLISITYLIFIMVVGISAQATSDNTTTQGEMLIVSKPENGKNFTTIGGEKIDEVYLPLEKTEVSAEISGFVSRTTVTQYFKNPYNETIEATYMFPLPHDASVDSMTMKIGQREIVGKIKTKEEAREIYETAKSQGRTASLLDQERENIFTQSVANILPGDSIKIEISYFETLKYDSGTYTYTFPMVVGPRFNPGNVEDINKVTSPTIGKDRNGHTISLDLKVDAGIKIKNYKSNTHEIDIINQEGEKLEIKLANKDEIPNKDFVFTYDVADDKPQVGIITYKNPETDHGYFTLIAEPQKQPTREERRNKEIIFVLDTSGSMSGQPMNALKQTMQKAINDLDENDYFNIYSFNSNTTTLFNNSVQATNNNKNEGQAFTAGLQAGGGTLIDGPLREALKDNGERSDRIRIIVILTDGDIANEREIIRNTADNIGSNRIFTLGIDNSPNRFLLDRLSEIGNGKTIYIQRGDNTEEKVDEFYNLFKTPVLTDIKIEWDGIEAEDILPTKFSDLYAGQPLYVYGKFRGETGTNASIKITGIAGSDPYIETIPLKIEDNENNSALSGLWARNKVKELYKDNYFTKNDNLKEQVTFLGLNYSIMTEYTSFVAEDDKVRNLEGDIKTVEVPIHEVDGKDYNNSLSESFDSSINSGGSSQATRSLGNAKTQTNNISSGGRAGPATIFFGNEKVTAIKGESSSADTALDRIIKNITIILYILSGIFLIYSLYNFIKNRGDKDRKKSAMIKLAIAIIIIVLIYFISISLKYILR